MSEYDGWIPKSPIFGHLYPTDFRQTKKEVIATFEKSMGLGSWRKYRRKGWKIVKVKLIEVKEET